MDKFEKLKLANHEKFVEFTHEGVTYWVKDVRPAESKRKLKEFKVLKNVGEKGAIQVGVNEAMPWEKWSAIAMLHDKNPDGSLTRSFEDSEVEEAYEMVSNSFITALSAIAKTLRPQSEDEAAKNE